MATEIDVTVKVERNVEDIDSSRLCQQFEDAFESTADERQLAERCRDYYDGEQLTDHELEVLARRKQPPVISNRIAPKIDALVGYEMRSRTDPKAYPRTPKHEDEAHSVTDALRFVCEENRYDEVRSSGAYDLFIQGICAVTVTVEMRGDDPRVKLTRVPWDRFYRDPHSRKRDFSDASYMGVVVWMDESEAVEQFPGKSDVIEACYTEADDTDTFGDRPSISWGDRKRKRVRVLQHRFRRKGEWWTCILCKGGYLRDPQPSPYVDEEGVPQCDIVATSAYIDRENRRYGIVKRMLSPQDEINKRRSKALHLLNSRQIIMENGAVDDVAQARKEAARADGLIKVNPDMRFEFVDRNDLVSGQFSLLQESKAEIDASGVNPAVEGDAQAPSGRAQQMMMQAGLAEMSSAFEALKTWSWEIYRQIWYRVRQYWTAQRWIRVTDDERNLQWVEINKPITRGEVLRMQAMESGDPEAVAQTDLAIANDPRMQEVVGYRNRLTELDVDIILEDGPDTVTVRQEQFDKLVDLKRSDPSAISTKALIQASDLRNKDELLEDLEQGGLPPQVQQQMQKMQEALQKAQQDLQEAQAKANDHQADNALKVMELQIKQEEARIDAQKAETDRYKAETERMRLTQEQVSQSPPQGGLFVGQ